MYSFLQKHDLKIILILVILSVLFYCFKQNWDWNDDNNNIGKLLQFTLSGFTFFSGCSALISILSIKNEDWGKLKNQKGNLTIGIFMSVLASGYYAIKLYIQQA